MLEEGDEDAADAATVPVVEAADDDDEVDEDEDEDEDEVFLGDALGATRAPVGEAFLSDCAEGVLLAVETDGMEDVLVGEVKKLSIMLALELRAEERESIASISALESPAAAVAAVGERVGEEEDATGDVAADEIGERGLVGSLMGTNNAELRVFSGAGNETDAEEEEEEEDGEAEEGGASVTVIAGEDAGTVLSLAFALGSTEGTITISRVDGVGAGPSAALLAPCCESLVDGRDESPVPGRDRVARDDCSVQH